MSTDQALSFGALLKRARRFAGLSQEQLAERAGYSAVYIRKLEGGARRPTATTIELLADALELEASERIALMEAGRRSNAPEERISLVGPVRRDRGLSEVDVHAFLIADIRGYTRFTEVQGNEAAARLTKTFADSARTIVGASGGDVIESRGDEVLAVFVSPRNAIRAALALRDHCIRTAEENPALPMHVGIGLDAGEAVPVDGGYRGSALNLAARLCNLAGAGQVFASETIVGLARKIEEVGYRERGRVQLKGYAEPVAVVQILPESELEDLSRRETFDVVLAAGEGTEENTARLATYLRAGRSRVWMPGEQPVRLEVALALTRCVLVLLGPNGLDAAVHSSLAAVFDPLDEKWHPRVLLVLLPGTPDPFDVSILPPFLTTRVWIDLRDLMSDEAESARRLEHAIKGGLDTEASARAPTDEQPYRGLEAFDEESAPFFFGRDADIQRLIERMKMTSFLAVLGPSGSGKSSLVKAGLLPPVRTGALRGSEGWDIRVFTPGSRPLTALAVQFFRLHPQESMRRTLDEMGVDSRTLHLATSLALADRPPGYRVLWVIDQFEEIFTLCDDELERWQFLANLLQACTVPDSRTVVVVTMRADFYAHCARYPELAARISADQYLVGPLGREALRQAIDEPAWRVGLQFEQGVVDRILEDVSDQPGTLPLLQYALLDLWQRRQGHILTLDGYRDTGGVQGAIAKRAEITFNRFTPEEQATTRRILLRLTQTGEGTADTRRRTSMAELVTQRGAAGSVERVVDALVSARLLTASRSEEWDASTPEDRQVEVSHEAVIRGWPRLRRWIDEDRAGLRTHRRLTESSAEWLRLGRDEGSLYRGATLVVAVEWAERNPDVLNQLEREFLDAALGLRGRERNAARRRIWLTLGGLLTALVIISFAAVFALIQDERAARDRDAAVSALWAQSSASLLSTGERRAAVLVAVEAIHKSRTSAAVTALRDALARFPVIHTLEGHENRVMTAFFSPDSRRLVTASTDGTAIIWDVRSGHELRTLDAHAGPLTGADFSPNGREVITSGTDGIARIWDAERGVQLRQLRSHRGAVESATFSPDGRLVATAGVDRTARLWEADSGRLLRIFRGHRYALHRVAFSPDGRTIVTSSRDGTARIWDVQTGRLLTVLSVGAGEDVTSAAFSADGRQALASVGGNASETRVWSLSGGRPHVTATLVQTGGPVWFAEFSPDGRWIATADNDATTRVWGADTKLAIALLGGHTDAVNSVEFSPDEHWLATASADGRALTRACDVCGSVDDLLRLAQRRYHGSLTSTEKGAYLTQP